MTYEEVDRAVYEGVRKAAIALGLLPDTSTAATAEEKRAIELAFVESKPAGFVPTNLYGTSVGIERLDLAQNWIVIDRMDERPGNVGYEGHAFEKYEAPGTPSGYRYRKLLLPSMSTNIQYEIRTITGDIREERLISAVLNKAFGIRCYLFGVAPDGTADTDKPFVFYREEYARVDTNQYFERVRRYNAQNIVIDPYTVVDAALPVMGQIHLGLGTFQQPDAIIALIDGEDTPA